MGRRITMTPLLNPSRYRPPELPKIVHRKRLIRLFNENEDKQVVFMIGQAAQGKSTLAADYLYNGSHSVVWLNMDEKDSDHPNFYYLLVHGMKGHIPENDFNNFLNSPQVAFGRRMALPRYKELISALANRLEKETVIVFDGMECLLPDAPSLALIDYLVNEAPPFVRIMVISREMPPYNIERLKIKHKAFCLNNADIAFTREEISLFFENTYQTILSDHMLERVWRITGGWAGGIVLIAESLIGNSESNGRLMLPDHYPDELKGEAVQYFSEEIFQYQPENIKTFLLKTSVLDAVRPDILSKVMSRDETRDIPIELVRRNLFIHSVNDPKKGRMYIYNQLFKTFLQNKFHNEFDENLKKSFLIQMAEALWIEDEIEEGVWLFLKAGAYDRASSGIMRIGMDMTIRGRLKDLATWISLLPEKRVMHDPWLLLYKALSSVKKGEMGLMEELAAIMEMFKKEGNIRGRMLTLAFLIEAAVFLGSRRDALSAWIAEGEALLKDVSGIPYYLYAKTALWLQIGFGYIAGAADLHKGISACRNAYILAGKMDNDPIKVNAVIISALGHSISGEFQAAEEALGKISHLMGETATPEYRTLQRIVNMDLALNKGFFDDAERIRHDIREDIETFGFLFLYPTFLDISGILMTHTQRFSEAFTHAFHLAGAAVLQNNTYYNGLSMRLQSMAHYFQGEYAAAAPLIKEAIKCLSESGLKNVHLNRAKLLAGIIFLQSGKLSEAETLLMESMNYFRKNLNHISASESYFALGMLENERNNKDKAAGYLNKGFEIVLMRHYTHFVTLSPADIRKACLLTLELGGKPGSDIASRLLSLLPEASGLSGEVLFYARNDAAIRLDADSSQASPTVPALFITTLGGLRITKQGGETIHNRKWPGNRPKLLLKAILVHGLRDIPKDILIDTLWPEKSPKAALNNFKVTLYRLRSVLEEEPDRYHTSYVHLKDNLVSLDRELCRTDIEDFNELYKHIILADKKEDPVRIMELCKEAIDTYRGDFLPEDLYLPWIESKRQALREKYIIVLNHMVEACESIDDLEQAVFHCKNIVSLDPYMEEASVRLMKLYKKKGMINDALKVYEKLHELLKSEMDAEPDPSTSAFYKSLLPH